MSKITCDQAVRALKELRTSNPAKNIAAKLGTDSRAVATALRQAVKDGRVTWSFIKGIAFYRFVRLAKAPRAAAQKGGA